VGQQPNANGTLSLQAEPFFLKQVYKDQLAFLERDSSEGANICNVWVYNFEHELTKISELLKKYTYVAMVSSELQKFESGFLQNNHFKQWGLPPPPLMSLHH